MKPFARIVNMETERKRSTDFPILHKMHKPHNTIELFVFFYLIQAPLLSGPSKSKQELCCRHKSALSAFAGLLSGFTCFALSAS